MMSRRKEREKGRRLQTSTDVQLGEALFGL